MDTAGRAAGQIVEIDAGGDPERGERLAEPACTSEQRSMHGGRE
jgi:hypothetical protein